MKWISRILTTPVDELTLSGMAQAIAILVLGLVGYLLILNWDTIWPNREMIASGVAYSIVTVILYLGNAISYLTIGNIFDVVSAYPQLTLMIVCYLIFRFRAWLHSLPVIGSIAPFVLAGVYFTMFIMVTLYLASPGNVISEGVSGVSDGASHVGWVSLAIVFGLFEYISAHAIVVLLVVICILLYRRRRCL